MMRAMLALVFATAPLALGLALYALYDGYPWGGMIIEGIILSAAVIGLGLALYVLCYLVLPLWDGLWDGK